MSVGEININNFKPYALWHLDGNSNDALGTYNGTDTSITYVNAKVNKGASFNGTTSTIATGNSGLTGDPIFFMSAWVKGSNGAIIGFGNAAVGLAEADMTVGVISGGLLSLEFSGSNSFRSATGLVDVTLWNHLAVAKTATGVISSANCKLWLNGDPVSGTAQGGTPNITNAPFVMGKDPNVSGDFFGGIMDEVLVSQTIPTDAQIKQYYSWSKGRKTVVI